ncbi:hypothetical protein niasHT_024687 [Heterodera trifolii]|uniref:ATP-binding protein n=1 Tax=Heterodera trifolii TaxID=157864 RepID=A0ABD2K7R2_9BILA
MSQQYLDALFTRGSHNWGVSVILVTQHLFNKELRVARTNSHYLVLMRNPAGALQIRTIANHLFPSRTAHFIEAYRDACTKNFGYLLVDMHPETPEEIRLRTNIYEQKQIVYIAKMRRSQMLARNESFLETLCNAKKVNDLIRDATDEQLLCLVEICLNILKGRVPLRTQAFE